jgi:xylulokinase
MRDAFLAIDVGTQSSRAAVLRLDGHVLAIASHPHTMVTPRPGWAEQNPADWWDATLRNVRDVVSKTADQVRVRAVAVCGQMHGAVPVARDGAPLATAVQLWCDKRAAPIASEVDTRTDRDALLRLAGNVPAPAWSGFKMAWMKREQPELYDRAWKILAPKDFINLRLAGVAATDRSEASGSFLMDSRDGTWSAELIELLDLEARHLPPIHASSEVIGTILPEVARETGLPAGTPVVAGSGDMLALLLGAGVTSPGAACDTSGTASIISFYTERPVADRRLMNLHAAGPHWISFGILDSGGGSLSWWRDQFIADTDNDGDVVYERMMADAAGVPMGSEGLLFLPYLLGERTLGSADSRGVFFGLHPRHGRAHATRAILEGICFDLRQSLEIARESGLAIAEMRTGGGGARSALWSQIKADVYGIPVSTLHQEEAGILGAAMLAGVGIGAYTSEADAANRLAQTRERFIPDQHATARYDKQYALFHDLHNRLQPSFQRGADLASS